MGAGVVIEVHAAAVYRHLVNTMSTHWRTASCDPERSAVLAPSFAEHGLPGAGRVCHLCPRLAAKLLRRRQPRPVGFAFFVIPDHASSLMLYIIDLNRLLEESCNFV